MPIGGLLEPIKSWGKNFLVALGSAVMCQWLLKDSKNHENLKAENFLKTVKIKGH